MTFAAADPVASGWPLKIISIAGGAPSALEQFCGDVSFTIDRDGEVSEICGLGVPGATGVRFQEKDVAHTGKDVRTWEVSKSGAGEFVAVPISPV